MRLSKVDPNSFSESEKIITKHVDLDWDVDFTKKVIKGSATYKFKILKDDLTTILLDVSGINISDVSILASGNEIPINFMISDEVKNIGSKLTLDLPCDSSGELTVRINYETSPEAAALQWLTAEQTLGKKHPYLFSQCQAINARSLFPCQDSPAVKFTYNGHVRYPSELKGLMSAILTESGEGYAKFEQTVPIPSYLLAIAVGDVVSRTLGPNCRVWAEEGIIDECAEEFSETPLMLQVASEICGPYVWKQYDLLVMPPSFPFGGMENPCLTFITPTLLAGDKSLADVVAHEISHSWTGNLVTKKNFEHFWLNEGFTVFVEGKIVGRMHGDKERDFHSIRNLTELRENIRTQLADTPELTKLIVDLTNCSPDDSFSSVPYIKGSTFLRYIEDTIGGPDIFEPFFKFYLNKYKYKSITTDDFKRTLYEFFLDNDNVMSKLEKIDFDTWLYGEGMPPTIPNFDSSLATVCVNLANLWATKSAQELVDLPDIKIKITVQQLIDFLSKLIEKRDIKDLNKEKVELLESTYNVNTTKNAEIRFRFLRLCIRARLLSRMDEIIRFANSNFRMKYVRPIYRDLVAWPEAKPIAIQNYEIVKNQMMKICAYTVAKDLGLPDPAK